MFSDSFEMEQMGQIASCNIQTISAVDSSKVKASPSQVLKIIKEPKQINFYPQISYPYFD
jgi:hypothetical protein